jgi:hypothetical protein
VNDFLGVADWFRTVVVVVLGLGGGFVGTILGVILVDEES